MSSLPIPQQQDQRPARAGSASNLRTIEHEDDLAPQSRSRRNSASNAGITPLPWTAPSAGAPTSAAAKAGLVPLPQGAMQATAENNALTAPVDWKEPDALDPSSATVLYVGKNKKPAHLPTALLRDKSPYFRRLLADDSKKPPADQTTFEDLDEFGTALFMLWLSDGGKLHGPHDFHSLAHYLSLYALAKKFEIESLENQVMDLTRHYYRQHNMTAPAYRLEYIYIYTPSANLMRAFLISTAAFRALEDSHATASLASASPHMHQTFYAHGSFISDSIKGVLMKNPEMAMDFCEALVKLHRCGEHDARYGLDCDWHEHEQTPKCPPQMLEVWQKDGAADEKPAADKAPEAPKTDAAKSATAPGAVAKPDEHKNDEGMFKKLSDKMKAHVDKAKEKMHAKKDEAAKAKEGAAKGKEDAKKDDKDKAPATPAAAPPPAAK